MKQDLVVTNTIIVVSFHVVFAVGRSDVGVSALFLLIIIVAGCVDVGLIVASDM